MAGDSIVTAQTYNVSKLFHLGRFSVPWHQRYYDWEPINVLNLLEDIDDAIAKKRSCYFLGSVMLMGESPGNFEINDGQQRFVTLSLICARLCQAFYDCGDGKREKQTMSFLFDLEPDRAATIDEADSLTPRITPPEGDNRTYRQIIQFRNVENGQLGKAWKAIDKFFSGKSFLDIPKKYGDFWDFMHDKLEIACLTIPKTMDPNSVFEALNFRGKTLEGFDLLRNYLYSFFNSTKTAEYRKSIRDDLENNIRNILSRKKPEEYARCHFLCEFGFLQKKQFYREARQKIEESVARLNQSNQSKWVYQFVQDFAAQRNVEIFRMLTTKNANDEFAVQFISESGTKQHKRNFRHFLLDVSNYSVMVPIVFSLLKRYLSQSTSQDAKTFAKIAHNQIRTITSFVSRAALTQPSFRPTLYERNFAGYAAKIVDAPQEEINLLQWLYDDYSDDLINDKKFRAKISLLEFRDDQKISRFLLAMATYQQADLLGKNPPDLTIEHILPQSPTYAKNWGFNDEEHRDCTYSLGNLTLLTPQDNTGSDNYNKSFERKKDTYKGCTILLTRSIADNYAQWTSETVKNRREELAKLAAQTWSFPTPSPRG